jgi:hypothetical protein
MEPSAYDLNAPKLLELGYRVLCIGPGTKQPRHYIPSWKKYQDTHRWNDPQRPPDKPPQPGAGIGILLGAQADGTCIVALDFDNDYAALAAMETFPGTVHKAGARGYTPIYRTSTWVESRDFRINGTPAVQVLSHGKQTVIPPTLHPDTGRPYSWESQWTLYNARPSELTELPADYIERIERILRPLGYQREAPRPTGNGHAGPETESPFRDLNNRAMRDLAAWVPELGLFRLRRQSGPHASYRSVASFRASSTGKPLKQRQLNLGISGAKGIKDFGTGIGYTPINLVMVVRRWDRAQAIAWLDERLNKDGPEIDFETLAGADANEQDTTFEEAEPYQAADGVKARPAPPAALGEAWHYGEPSLAQMPMLINEFLPQKGYGHLGGQWGTFKTFITDDLAVAIASGGKFAGQRVAFPGAVVQIELEGSYTELRIHAAAQARGCKEQLPIVHLRSSPPNIMNNGRPNPQWTLWAKELATYARKVASYYGVPPALITIDPQNRIAGFRDEDSSAEGQIVSNALAALSKQADCLVLVVDHLGKDPAAGLRGTSAKETNPLFILNTGETRRDIYSERQLEVRKMRNGRSGFGVSFWMEDTEVTIQQIVQAENGTEIVAHIGKTLTVRWADQQHATDRPGAGAPKLTPQEHLALSILIELIGRTGSALPDACKAPGLRGVAIDAWRLALMGKTVLEGKHAGNRFYKIKSVLLRCREINVGHGFVCATAVNGAGDGACGGAVADDVTPKMGLWRKNRPLVFVFPPHNKISIKPCT